MPAISEATSHGQSKWARTREAGSLGRVARAERLLPDGVVLGWFRGRVLQSPREDSVLVLGVQRSGKTSTVVVPTLLGWGGAVVATSTKEELVRLTGRHRRALAPVWVFAPLDRDWSWIQELGLQAARWNPIREVSDAAIAAETADLFTSHGTQSPSAHWFLSAANLLTGLLISQHQSRGDLRRLLEQLNRTSHQEYFGLATEQADHVAAELLAAYAHTPEREAGSIASTARACLSIWLDERVARATAEGPGQLDIDRLLGAGGSLYLVAPAEDAERCRPLFSALLQSILRRATARARAQGGVLNPRLLLALDEVANFARIPRLAAYVSTGPGQGIQFLLCFHDLAQLEAGYGAEAARTVWNNCRARLLLPGQCDLKTLEDFSRAMGERTVVYRPAGAGAGRGAAVEQRTSRPLAALDELRRMSQAVLLHANAPPAQLGLRRWDQVCAWRDLVSAASQDCSPVHPFPPEEVCP